MDLGLNREQLRALIAASVAVGALAAGWWWLGQPAEAVPAPTPSESTSAIAPITAKVIVDVVGKVRRPGVVELPAGSRVRDAVEAAGGVMPGVAAGVNLARLLVDGEQILIGQPPAAVGDGKVNLNTATAAELEELPGVGPVLAGRIVAYRESHGPFRTVAELDEVSGVGPAIMASIADVATCG